LAERDDIQLGYSEKQIKRPPGGDAPCETFRIHHSRALTGPDSHIYTFPAAETNRLALVRPH